MTAILREAGTAAAILLCGYIGIRIVLRILKKSLVKSHMDEAHYAFILNAVRVLLWFIIITTVLGSMGLPSSTFIAVLGTAGAAIALALRDSLTNFVGGVQILFSKPFLKGDYIENLEVSGMVEEINLLFTTLKTYDNRVITIPNGRLSNGPVVNHTREQNRRIDLIFSLRCGEDTERVREILLAIAEAEPRIFKDPPVFVGISGQKDGLILVELQAWALTPDYWDVKCRFLELTNIAFKEAGIVIPAPYMDIQLKR